MSDREEERDGNNRRGIFRRDFLKISGTIAVGAGVAGADPARGDDLAGSSQAAALPPSRGYILVDTRKCQGCLTCMLACSLAHQGRESLSLSRIQVIQDSFAGFPEDITIEQCRQCLRPECVEQCPTGALHVDAQNGNIRTVNQEECNGCMACVESCPHQPSRAIWNHETKLAHKCDLCAQAPFWSEPGGPGGKQACVEACPVGAIKFQAEMPVQEGDSGYKVNLRGESWGKLGYPID